MRRDAARHRGTGIAILCVMTVLLRYAGLALAVLVVALVLGVCGEGVACTECAHACCERADRADRLRSLFARILSGSGLSGIAALANVGGWVSPLPPLARNAAPHPLTREISQLRI